MPTDDDPQKSPHTMNNIGLQLHTYISYLHTVLSAVHSQNQKTQNTEKIENSFRQINELVSCAITIFSSVPETQSYLDRWR
jgi:hypothetical protein